MPNFSRALDLNQGFSFKKDKQTPVGHFLRLTIDGTALRPDFTVTSPDTAASSTVAGVMAHMQWPTGIADPISLKVQISAANKQALSGIAAGANVAVGFHFVLFDYDPISKKYFKSFFQNAALNGLVDTSNQTSYSLAGQASTEVSTPENYALTLSIRPQTASQTIFISTSAGKTITKPWASA